MPADTLAMLQTQLIDQRHATTVALTILGHPVPGTEKEWLLFNLNEAQRQLGHQKPLENLNGERSPGDMLEAFGQLAALLDSTGSH